MPPDPPKNISPNTPDATIVITTKNRKDDLRQAVASALAQQGANVEVLVVDDGSDDGTAEMIRSEFPAARLHRVEESQGYIVQRNLGAEMASAPVIFSIDDDAVFQSPHTVAQTLAEFDDDRIGAVAIPYINVNQSDKVLRQAPDNNEVWLTDMFTGTAYALRRDLFLKLGGFRKILFHQGEERDYCIRLMEAGYVIRLGRAEVIHHFESPQRDHPRVFIYTARNNVLWAWHNVPMPFVLGHWMGTCARSLQFGVQRGHPIWMLQGLLRGFGVALGDWKGRQPVSARVYRLSRILRHRAAVTMGEITERGLSDVS